MLPAKRKSLLQTTLLATGFGVLVVVCLVSVWLVREAANSGDLVADTLAYTADLATLQAEVRQAESGQRGYLLTGEAPYLRDYEAATQKVGPTLAHLRELIADKPWRQKLLAELEPQISAKMAELAHTIDLAKAGQRAAALDVVNSQSGFEIMSEVNRRIASMIAQAERVLRENTDDADRATVMLFAVLTIGLFLIATLAVISLSVLRRSARETEHAYVLLAQANEELEDRIAERTADLQEANDEIQRFAYIVSHDLRSPLVNIMGFTSELEALRDDLMALIDGRQAEGGQNHSVLPPVNETTIRRDYNEALAFIKSSISKMDRLINAILHLSRAGRRQFTAQPVDLNQLFAEIAASLAHRLQEEGITFNVTALPQVTSDRLALEQVFSNLLDNAIKYMRNNVPGRIDVTVTDTVTHYLISVSDNGRGIAQSDLERIFDLFRRAGVQDRPGEGIGLAHVRTLVRRLGGSIKVDSTPDQGTTFTVALPKRWTPAR